MDWWEISHTHLIGTCRTWMASIFHWGFETLPDGSTQPLISAAVNVPNGTVAVADEQFHNFADAKRWCQEVMECIKAQQPVRNLWNGPTVGYNRPCYQNEPAINH